MVQFNDLTGLLLAIVTISLLPFVAMVVTSYAKIVVVLGLLRNALGVQQVPPNMVLNGVAILISAYVMAPIFLNAANAMQQQQVSPEPSQAVMQAFSAAKEPFRAFLEKHADEREKRFFVRTAAAVWSKEEAQKLSVNDFVVLAPAFTLTELTDAFKIGFLLYIAFIIVDLIVANILLSMGLTQITPVTVAIPFKLLLFVVMNGWSTLLHGLIMTYR